MTPTLLADCLQAELQALRTLHGTLLQEHQALLERTVPTRLAELAEQKNTEFERLETLGQQRNRHLQVAGYTPGHEGTQHCVAQHPELLAVWEALEAATQEAKTLNERNGMMIRAQLSFHQEAMAALQAAQARNAVYGPSGRAQTMTPTRSTRSHRA